MSKPIKILIAGHDATDLALLHHELEKARIDYAYKVVMTAPEYAPAITGYSPDIILADYSFPAFNGASVFQISREIAPDTPFIFVSGTISEEKSMDLISSGVTDYVLKENWFALGTKVKRAIRELIAEAEKKGLEKAFLNEKERFYEIILQSPSSVGILRGPEHIYEMVNPFYLRLIGKDNDIIGKSVKEVLPEVVDQGFIEILDNVYNTGEPFYANEKLVKLDVDAMGNLIDAYVNIVYQPYRDDQNVIQGVLFFTVDVTEQVVSRRRIEESENRFRAIIEKSTEIITLSSGDGRIVYISPSVTKIFGYCLEDLAETPALNFIHPDDLDELDKQRKALLQSNHATFEMQLRLRHKNGTWIWCHAVITNMLQEPGVYALVGNFRDISERKIIERQLEFTSNNLKALINNTNDLLWSVDLASRLITFNQPFAKTVKLLTGTEVAKGDDTLSLRIAEEQLNRYQQFYERAFSGEAFTEIEYTASPSEFWSEISFYPIRDNEAVTGTACHSRNITNIKKAEQNLFQSERRYRRILETAQEGIWLIDEKDMVTFVNEKMCRILGYSKEEILGKNYGFFKHPEEQQAAVAGMARRKNGEKETYETKFITKDGESVWVCMSANPILNDDGLYSGALGMVTDITESKTAADNMLRLTNRLLLATKSAEMGIWEWDIASDHLTWDTTMYQLYDMTESQFGSVYEGWLNALHPEDRNRINEEIQMAITGKKGYDTEFRIIRSDSSLHYIKAKGITEKDAEGKIVKLIGVNWDITRDKKRAEQLYLLESVVTHTTESVMITEAEPMDESGAKIVYVNDAFTKMTGYSSEELLGRTRRIFQGPKSDKQELRHFREGTERWENSEITIIKYKKNGEEFWTEISASPVMNENGKYTHWISIEKDVTARKLAELKLKDLNEELRRHSGNLVTSNAELEQFAYVASHDLQEPLRMITSFLSLLDKKYSDVVDAKGKTYIAFAVDGATRMRQIISDLLEYSRIGRMSLEIESVDLNQLIAEIGILFAQELEEKKGKLYYDLLPILSGHLVPIRQVFHNLIGNALKYSGVDRPSEVHVVAADFDDYWQFSVGDNGIGIESDYFEKIFIIFRRLHNKDKFSGTGIGLAITKKIIDGWGGKIWVESEVGTGTTFHFTLPK